MNSKYTNDLSFAFYIDFTCLAFAVVALVFWKTSSTVDRLKQTFMLKKSVKVAAKDIIEKNAQIFELQNHALKSLSDIVENRDLDTGKHIKRSVYYVKLLAERAYRKGLFKDVLTEHYVECVVKAAPLHDIGKIVISDKVLKKPERLTDDEYKLMQQHTVFGKNIIKEILNTVEDELYFRISTDVALCHHERWDGNGYPYQLRGNEIPLCARLMAIADVFDALTSPRCYQAPPSKIQNFLKILTAKY